MENAQNKLKSSKVAKWKDENLVDGRKYVGKNVGFGDNRLMDWWMERQIKKHYRVAFATECTLAYLCCTSKFQDILLISLGATQVVIKWQKKALMTLLFGHFYSSIGLGNSA